MRTPRDKGYGLPELPPLTMMQQAAAGLHEAYTAYVGAGFEPHQALYLVGQFVNPAHHQPPPAPPSGQQP